MGVATVTNQISTCQIWGEGYPAVGQNIPELSRIALFTECERAGGGYVVLDDADSRLDRLSDDVRARLTTWLVDQRLQGNACPTVTKEIIDYAIQKTPLQIHARADRLLRFLGKQTKAAGDAISLFKHSNDDGRISRDSYGSVIYPETPTNPIFLHALAWSESTSPDEISYLVSYLEEEDWVRETFKGVHPFPRSNEYQVTVRGHARIADEAANTDSARAFVAMWFDDSLNAAYDEGIAQAIRDCGFEPRRIDHDPSVDKIDDAIIAEIRQSRFLVADFTHGNEGARGGVYYEAGFAHGLGIPVIFTCRGDMIDQIHFDTRQYAHIVWNNSTELRKGLRDRILARIGNGPSIIQ